MTMPTRNLAALLDRLDDAAVVAAVTLTVAALRGALAVDALRDRFTGAGK